jgi:Zinc finger, C2H2 type
MRSFASPGNMRKHQATVQSCIRLQKNRGSDIEEKKFSCHLCSKTYSTKSSLERHLKTNHSDQSSSGPNIQTINTVNGSGSVIGTQTNQYFILNFGDTFSELTPEKMVVLTHKIMNSIPIEATEAGVGALTQEIAPLLLTNEKGNSVTRVVDASRGKLATINNQGEEEDDIKGTRTAALLRDPMKQVGMEHYNKSNKKEDIRRTLETMMNKSEFNKQALPALLTVLPTEFKCSASDMDEKIKEANDKSDNIIRTYFAELDARNAKKGKNKCEEFIKELQDSYILRDRISWHPKLCFVMEMDEKVIPTIMGRQSKREDKMSDLSKADIKFICKRGGKKLLHPRYLGDEAEAIDAEKRKELADEKARKAAKSAARKVPKEVIERGDKIRAYLRNSGMNKTSKGDDLMYLSKPELWLKMLDESLPTSDPENNVPLFEIIGFGPSQFDPIKDFHPYQLEDLDNDPFLAPFIAKKYANAARPRKLSNDGFPKFDD